MKGRNFIAYVFFILGNSWFAKASLHFASIGNWGTGSKVQKKVAETLKTIVDKEHVTFLLSPGSNFEKGVTSSSDEKWDRLYNKIYATETKAMEVPMFTVLGAGDWLGDFNAQINRNQQAYLTGLDNPRGLPHWTMPNWWYHYFTHFSTNASISLLKSGHKDMSVGFIFIDTWVLSSAFPFKDVSQAAWADLKKTLEIAPKLLDYIIVVGDKPIYSSGPSKGDSQLAYYLLPLLRKAQVDAYIAGHDHDMEVIDSEGLGLIICGSSGSYGRRPVLKASQSKFFSEKAGFCLHELNAEGLTTKFIDGEDASVLYTHVQPKKVREQREYGSELINIGQLPPVVLHPIGDVAHVAASDTFTKIVGTIGLLIASVHVVLATTNAFAKATNI
ncbi:bifunctional Metallo-dependent phosphatase-like/Calcineurin-like phosphoesterase domain [Babesia duncani]|uniref:Bifunctional Metallo-dependent phosphatase-like/Calcineurin-like phosphoesterase domain n=1 Tax=Babesia duncani TaxID=323732 RepID=A0AAD9PJZ7_9APIC|nr:bifunctional Metallo-dependent phosphatase-like/Calcineurin-like phosphoesterase domain [Babesia duncani]